MDYDYLKPFALVILIRVKPPINSPGRNSPYNRSKPKQLQLRYRPTALKKSNTIASSGINRGISYRDTNKVHKR